MINQIMRIGVLLGALLYVLAADPAAAAARFWVGGVGTWDASDTTHWSATTGGAGGASVPGSADAATFDASSGGGTVTLASGYNPTIQGLTTGAFTGTLDFATNNVSPTFNTSGWSNSGTGTRTINCGTGTFAFTGTNTTGFLDWTTGTNLTLSCSSATFAFSGSTINARSILLSSATLSYPNITIAANSSVGQVILSGTNATIASLSIASPNFIGMSNGPAWIFTTPPTFTGTSSTSPIGLTVTSGTATFTSASAITGSWIAVRGIVFAGGGNATFTNSFDLGRNSISGGGTLSITSPVAGGGGRCIGC